jgi:sec-independent protein translocase protein TatA
VSVVVLCNTSGCLALFGRIGPWEVVIVLAVILLLFGGRKLPELARGLAKGLKAFKRELKDVKDELKDVDETASDEEISDQSDAKNTEDKSG